MPKRPVDSIQVFASMPMTMIFSIPCCLSCWFEVSVGKAALRPMLLDNNVPLLWDKVRMPLTAPSTLCENLILSAGELPGSRVLPMGVVAGFRAVMGNDEDPDT